MTYPQYLRDKAISLRINKRLTIDEVADRLSLPRSTIYYWVRDIPFVRDPNSPAATAAQRKGTRAMRRKYRALREAAYEDGLASFAKFSEDRLFRDFVCLYIAEGYKRSRNSVKIGNSDPAMLVLSQVFMSRFASRRLRYGLQYHADQDPAELAEFWSETLGIAPDRVKLQRKSNSNQMTGRNWRSKYGVLTIAAGDTYFRARLQAWIDCMKAEWV